MRVHRVAWRLEKPRRLTINLAAAILLTVMGVGFIFGLWNAPPLWAYGLLCLSLAASAFAQHLEAHNEYQQYLRIKEVGK